MAGKCYKFVPAFSNIILREINLHRIFLAVKSCVIFCINQFPSLINDLLYEAKSVNKSIKFSSLGVDVKLIRTFWYFVSETREPKSL